MFGKLQNSNWGERHDTVTVFTSYPAVPDVNLEIQPKKYFFHYCCVLQQVPHRVVSRINDAKDRKKHSRHFARLDCSVTEILEKDPTPFDSYKRRLMGFNHLV